MEINRTHTAQWKNDVLDSVHMYNEWFFDSAPAAYRHSRLQVIEEINTLFQHTNNLRNVTPQQILDKPALLGVLRQITAPPLARDRLIGLANVQPSLVHNLEQGRLPRRMAPSELDRQLRLIIDVVERLADRTLFEWLDESRTPTDKELALAQVVVADRRTGALSDPIIRNAQEERQLNVLEQWLTARRYRRQQLPTGSDPSTMTPGTYAIHQNIPVINASNKTVNMPLDLVVQPWAVDRPTMPILIEAKSAGDFTNTNKRRKEEATKLNQLRHTYGSNTYLVLFLCGYFDAGYLGYSAAEGIDWVWEHRVEDLSLAGL